MISFTCKCDKSLVLQGRLVGVFGVPDMGPACSEKHVPNYLKNVCAVSFLSIRSSSLAHPLLTALLEDCKVILIAG